MTRSTLATAGHLTDTSSPLMWRGNKVKFQQGDAKMTTGIWVLAALVVLLAVAVIASHVRLMRQMERDICAVFRAGMEVERARANAPDQANY